MTWNNYDLNLIRVFIKLVETGGVSAAADELAVTQPTVSYSLKKLRNMFNDPLFNRTPHGITPTATAERLYLSLKEALTSIDGAVQQAHVFDPLLSKDQFTISLTDLGDLVFLPLLTDTLSRQAPGASLAVIPFSRHSTVEQLIRGEVDACIATPVLEEKGVKRQVLYPDAYVAFAANSHPRLRSEAISIADFERERHIQVTDESGHTGPAAAIKRLGLKQNVALRVSRFTAIPQVVENTELIGIVPLHVGKILAAGHNLRLLELPFEVPRVEISVYSRDQVHATPAQAWFQAFLPEALAPLLPNFTLPAQ